MNFRRPRWSTRRSGGECPIGVDCEGAAVGGQSHCRARSRVSHAGARPAGRTRCFLARHAGSVSRPRRTRAAVCSTTLAPVDAAARLQPRARARRQRARPHARGLRPRPRSPARAVAPARRVRVVGGLDDGRRCRGAHRALPDDRRDARWRDGRLVHRLAARHVRGPAALGDVPPRRASPVYRGALPDPHRPRRSGDRRPLDGAGSEP